MGQAGHAVLPIAGLIVCNTVIELLLIASDLGWVGSPYWRFHIYDNFAFITPLLHHEPANYPLQPISMFVTYSFLHGGPLHLAFNMGALCVFGPEIARTVGSRRFLMAYFVTAIGGALLYAALSNTYVPMVGASGALFGLVGILVCWGYLERRFYGESLRAVYRALAFLLAYNLGAWLLLSGGLAWQTHLGGFLTGWVIALIWGRPIYRRQRRQRGTAENRV